MARAVAMAESALGVFIREQRLVAQLSLREMARLTSVSNAYLSQVERGLHEPSLHVLRAVADALQLPFEELVRRAVPVAADQPGRPSVEQAIRADDRLSADQRSALLGVLEGFLEANDRTPRKPTSTTPTHPVPREANHEEH